MNHTFIVVILVVNFTYKYLSAEVVLSESLLAPKGCRCKWSCVCFIVCKINILLAKQINSYTNIKGCQEHCLLVNAFLYIVGL